MATKATGPERLSKTAGKALGTGGTAPPAAGSACQGTRVKLSVKLPGQGSDAVTSTGMCGVQAQLCHRRPSPLKWGMTTISSREMTYGKGLVGDWGTNGRNVILTSGKAFRAHEVIL